MISITQLENKYHNNFTIFNDINIIINFINYNNKSVSSATSHQCSPHKLPGIATSTKQYGDAGSNGSDAINGGEKDEEVFEHMYQTITIVCYIVIMIIGELFFKIHKKICLFLKRYHEGNRGRFPANGG